MASAASLAAGCASRVLEAPGLAPASSSRLASACTSRSRSRDRSASARGSSCGRCPWGVPFSPGRASPFGALPSMRSAACCCAFASSLASSRSVCMAPSSAARLSISALRSSCSRICFCASASCCMLCCACVPLSRSEFLLSSSSCFCISGVMASRSIFWMSRMRDASVVSSAFAFLRRDSSSLAFMRRESTLADSCCCSRASCLAFSACEKLMALLASFCCPLVA